MPATGGQEGGQAGGPLRDTLQSQQRFSLTFKKKEDEEERKNQPGCHGPSVR